MSWILALRLDASSLIVVALIAAALLVAVAVLALLRAGASEDD